MAIKAAYIVLIEKHPLENHNKARPGMMQSNTFGSRGHLFFSWSPAFIPGVPFYTKYFLVETIKTHFLLASGLHIFFQSTYKKKKYNFLMI